jgi:hypothetical protein
MSYKELIQKLGKIVDESKLLLRVQGEVICIDAVSFHDRTINKIQRLLQSYDECEWWIMESDVIKGVMYKIKNIQIKPAFVDTI